MLESSMDALQVIYVKSKTIFPKVFKVTTVDTPKGAEIYSVDWNWLCYNNNQDYFNLCV